jgi:putative holliday junction resolvase
MIILALDVGERRIGIAVSDPSGTLATPHSVIERRSRAEDFETVARLVRTAGAQRVVVGLPLSLDGQLGPQARRVARYARALAAVLDVPLDLVDERYSTVTANALLTESEPPRRARGLCHARGVRDSRRRRTSIDAAAAAVILQDYLEQQRAQGKALSQLGAGEHQG